MVLIEAFRRGGGLGARLPDRGVLSRKKDCFQSLCVRIARCSADAPPALPDDLQQGHNFINLFYDLSPE